MFDLRLGLLWLGLLSGSGGGLAAQASDRVLVLAGGCFWGVEAIFEHIRGVRSVTSGLARPSDAASGFVPVEAVRIVYDPSRLKPDQLLTVFFTVAHDPTSRDRQGPDAGPEYRAMVFYQSASERTGVESFLAGLERTTRFSGPIVTEVRALGAFTAAEAWHQDFGAKHPTDPYVVRNDLPKLKALKEQYPSLYQPQRAP